MRFKELRGNKTQTEISKNLNIPQTTYSNYENGISEPNIKKLIEIADYYKVSLDYLCEHKTPYQQDLGYLDENDKAIIELCKQLNEINKIKAISYISGLIAGQ